MNYLITKLIPDSRRGICGFMIPDGFMTVVGLTFENQQQLRNIMTMHKQGYKVQKTTLPEGYYAPNGRRVTLDSIWKWYMYGDKLVYIDPVPEEGVEEIMAPHRDVRPPDMSERPEYVSLDDLPDEEEPPEVRRAREILEQNTAPAPQRIERPVAKADQIPVESDVETLQKADPKVDELTMLRTALDAKGIPWKPAMNRMKLRKLLDAAA